MNEKARIVICGQISQYNTGLDQPATGPRFLHRVLFTRATIQGILYADWSNRMDEMIQQMLVWIQQGKLETEFSSFHLDCWGPPIQGSLSYTVWWCAGKIQYKETVVEGFEQLPKALNSLFHGVNIGKMVVKV